MSNSSFLVAQKGLSRPRSKFLSAMRLQKKLGRVFFFLIILVHIGNFARPQEGDQVYSLTQAGKTVGSLRVFWDGNRVIQGAFRNEKGLVVFQDRVDSGHYVADFEREGRVRHVDFKVNPTLTFFDLRHLHHLLPLKSLFPRNQGEVRRFKMIDPDTREPFETAVENVGYQIVTLEQDRVKLMRYLVDLKGTEVDVYLDKSGNLVLMEVPQRQLSLTLEDVEAASYPIESWELKNQSDCCTKEEIQIQAPSGKVMEGEEIIPLKGSHFPGALVFGPKSQANFLDSLAYQLSDQGVVPFVFLSDDAVHMTERMQNSDTLFRFLRRQPKVDPGRMFVIGFGEGSRDVVSLMMERKDLSGAVLLSPETALFESEHPIHSSRETDSSTLVDLIAAEPTAVLILQGEKDSLTDLEGARQWVSEQNHLTRSELVSWSLIPGVGRDFLASGALSGKFTDAGAQRKVDLSVYKTISAWLEGHGIIGPR